MRRQFYEIQVKTPAPIATQALVRIAALYAIEADIRGLSADERRQARQRRTKPLLDDLRLRFEAQLVAVSTIAGAIRYTLSRWHLLASSTTAEIDSNVVERAIRPIAATAPMRNSLNTVTSRSLSVGATCAGSSTSSHACNPPDPLRDSNVRCDPLVAGTLNWLLSLF